VSAFRPPARPCLRLRASACVHPRAFIRADMRAHVFLRCVRACVSLVVLRCAVMMPPICGCACAHIWWALAAAPAALRVGFCRPARAPFLAHAAAVAQHATDNLRAYDVLRRHRSRRPSRYSRMLLRGVRDETVHSSMPPMLQWARTVVAHFDGTLRAPSQPSACSVGVLRRRAPLPVFCLRRYASALRRAALAGGYC
jgi:hypothetical protein